MITFQISPIELEGFSDFADKASGVFSNPDQGNSDFSNILNQLQNSGQFENSDNEALSFSSLSPEHLQMLQTQLKDGKSLPQAAEFVFAEIQKELAALAENGVTPEQLQDAYVQLSIVAKILPEDVKNQLNDALKALKQVLQEVASGQTVKPEQPESDVSANTDEARLPQQPQPQSQLESQLQSPLHPQIVSSPATADLAPQQPASETAPLASEVKPQLETGQPQAALLKPKPEVNAFSNAANFNTPNLPARGPAFMQEIYGQPVETAGQLDPDKLAAEGKPIVAASPNANTAKLTAAMSLDHFSATISTGNTAQQGTSAGFSGNGQNTSFAQLFSQAVPQPVTQNLHKPEWGNAVAQRITWMVGNKLQSAQLRIHPAHLGPVEIKLKIENSMANVSFVSNHQVVRDALEQSIPRLKDMLEEQSLDLVNVDIGEQHQAEQGETAAEFSSYSMQATSEEVAVNEENSPPAQNQPVMIDVSALLDTYA